jgi:hypothetical protein
MGSRIIEEALRRQRATKEKKKEITVIEVLKSELFGKQTDFLNDKSKLKAGFCTRRAGKSEMCAYALIIQALSKPNCDVIYLGLTRATAKRVMWSRKLLKILQTHNIEYLANKAELTITLVATNSTISLGGADNDVDSLNKLLGNAFNLVIIDEAQSFGPHLKSLVYDTLKPTVAETEGTIILIGTPGDVPAGFFYDVTTGIEKTFKWTTKSWSWKDNPHVKKSIGKELSEAIANNPLFTQTSEYQRNWEGKWVIEDNWRVYKWTQINFSDQCKPISKDYVYVLGVDLGWNDATAFVLWGFCPESPNLYLIKTEKHKFMDLADVAAKVNEYQANYQIIKTVMDCANRQGVETMKTRFSLHNVDAAEKSAKVAFIETMNSDLAQGVIKLTIEHFAACESLLTEAYNLQWDREAWSRGKKVENSRQDNHLLDAALYSWRASKHYFGGSVIERKQIDLGSQEYYDSEEAKYLQEAEKRYLLQQRYLSGEEDYYGTEQ